MDYKCLRKLFHVSDAKADEIYHERFNSPDTLHLPLSIAGNEAFCLMNAEVYQLILKAERLDKQITAYVYNLPGKAIEHYMLNCLVNEVVLTNEIEGVNSSRREIGEVLDRLESDDRKGRFHGIVEKYLALQKQEVIPIATCEDIRKIYNDLVLEEVVARNPKNAPDGQFFRAGGVDVLDATQKPIHRGIEPEEKLIEAMERALGILNNRDIEPLVRVSLFHFIFGYAHPFYDGNGRTGRFLSSYVLSHELNPLVGFRISYSIKDQIGKYYKAFSLCEHPLNRGDLTPFVIMFSELIVEAMKSMRDSLADKKAEMERARRLVKSIPGIEDEKDTIVRDRLDLAFILIQAALFADRGISMADIASTMEMSEPTAYKRLKFFQERGLVARRKLGRKAFYSLDLNLLGQSGA